MNKKYRNKLYKRYAKLLKTSIDVDDGWLPLIEKVCEQLQWDIDRNKYQQIAFSTIKEKLGGLRLYYIYVENDYRKDDKCSDLNIGVQEGIIRFAEQLSFSICEECGTNQNVSQTKCFWVKTLCEACQGRFK